MLKMSPIFSRKKKDAFVFFRCPIRFPNLQVKAIKSIEISTCFVQETHPTPQRCDSCYAQLLPLDGKEKSDRNLQKFHGWHPSMPHKKIKNTISGNEAKILYTVLMQYIFIYTYIHTYIYIYVYTCYISYYICILCKSCKNQILTFQRLILTQLYLQFAFSVFNCFHSEDLDLALLALRLAIQVCGVVDDLGIHQMVS